MKATLIAVGCIGLFGCALTGTIQGALTASKETTQRAPRRAQDTTKRGGVTRKGSTQLNERKAARRELATRFRLRL
jgi:hypothetical protein